MPNMMENIVMRKCSVSLKKARKLVSSARETLNLQEKSILWSKELENECLRLHNVSMEGSAVRTELLPDARELTAKTTDENGIRTKPVKVSRRHSLEYNVVKPTKIKKRSSSLGRDKAAQCHESEENKTDPSKSKRSSRKIGKDSELDSGTDHTSKSKKTSSKGKKSKGEMKAEDNPTQPGSNHSTRSRSKTRGKVKAFSTEKSLLDTAMKGKSVRTSSQTPVKVRYCSDTSDGENTAISKQKMSRRPSHRRDKSERTETKCNEPPRTAQSKSRPRRSSTTSVYLDAAEAKKFIASRRLSLSDGNQLKSSSRQSLKSEKDPTTRSKSASRAASKLRRRPSVSKETERIGRKCSSRSPTQRKKSNMDSSAHKHTATRGDDSSIDFGDFSSRCDHDSFNSPTSLNSCLNRLKCNKKEELNMSKRSFGTTGSSKSTNSKTRMVPVVRSGPTGQIRTPPRTMKAYVSPTRSVSPMRSPMKSPSSILRNSRIKQSILAGPPITDDDFLGNGTSGPKQDSDMHSFDNSPFFPEALTKKNSDISFDSFASADFNAPSECDSISQTSRTADSSHSSDEEKKRDRRNKQRSKNTPTPIVRSKNTGIRPSKALFDKRRVETDVLVQKNSEQERSASRSKRSESRRRSKVS